MTQTGSGDDQAANAGAQKDRPATPPSNDADPPSHGPIQIGSLISHYEVIRELGQGGMGTVYLARDVKLGRLVALKLLTKLDGVSTQRFLIEARATARCKHENIVVIHEVDEHEGHPYMVLEYVEGQTLRAWNKDRRAALAGEDSDRSRAAVPASAAVELIVPVVRALTCAHKAGIVHRDLKPANIMIDASGPIKVLDFGIAKVREGDAIVMPAGEAALTAHESAPLGTLPYMSPEQWGKGDVDGRSDLWAVGIMLYELVTGAHPLFPLTLYNLSQVARLKQPMPKVSDARPDLGPLADVIDRCLKKPRDERFASAEDLLAALEALLPGQKAFELGEGKSPFTGLAAFQEADAARFFGREQDVAAAITKLRHHPLLAVVGPSGAGKSSFVRAGIIPALKRSGEGWEALVVRPGQRPLAALAELCNQRSGAKDERVSASSLREVPGLVGSTLRARCREASRRILLFVDQFEELYTLGAAKDERAAFVACLAGAADDASSPLRVALSIRSDFLDRTAEDRKLLAEVTRGLSLLPPMGQDGLREALKRPVEAARYRFESDDMIEEMLAALRASPSPLPLLQFTATRLWEARDRDRRLLTRESYEKLGGVGGALSTHADAVLAGLSPADQRICRAVFLRLCTPERTRAVVGLDDLRALAEEGAAVEQVVLHLADARLLLLETVREREGTTVELVHESLIDRWAKLKQWLDESEQDAEVLARLRAAAQQWEASGEAEGLLWRDRAAEEAVAWRDRRRADQGAAHASLGKREDRYLLAVASLLTASRRAARRRTLVRAALLAALPLTAIGVYGAEEIRTRRAIAAEIAEDLGAASAAAHRAAHRAEDLEQLRAEAFKAFDTIPREQAEPLWTRVRALDREVDDLWADTTRDLETALMRDGRRRDVRERLAEALFQRILLAERDHRDSDRAELVRRLSTQDVSGAFRERLETPAHVSVATTPPGAAVSLARYDLEDGRRALHPVRDLGPTPILDLTVPPGSYRLTFRRAGAPEIYLPILLSRGERYEVAIDLPASVPEGYVYIPKGRFLFGMAGPEELRRDVREATPERERTTGAFLIERHEVTYREWIAFLRAIPPEERELRRPHTHDSVATLDLATPNAGPYQLTLQPRNHPYQAREGEQIHYLDRARRADQDWLRLPVSGISWEDAHAYLKWLDQSGHLPRARLCDVREWEWAARGADGRNYPSGDRLSPDDVNVDVTYGRKPLAFGPDEVGSHPASDSPFGVTDLAGNVWEWMRSDTQPSVPTYGGGSFYHAISSAHSGYRYPTEPATRDVFTGLRVCADIGAPRDPKTPDR